MHKTLYSALEKRGFEEFRPSQEKSLHAGLLEGKNLLVCTPTASGKTLVAEIAAMQTIFEHKQKAIYIVPLKALASEKYKEFKHLYGKDCKIAISIGDKDSPEERLSDADLIFTTSEKLDAILRHRPSWVNTIGCVVVDEVHLLNDTSRGPCIEVVITLLRQLVPAIQWVCLSATIGNAEAIAEWLQANLIQDTWRPVPLEQGIYSGEKITFY